MSSPTKPPATSLDDLPPEMIVELFRHLHLKDLAACSMVNKRWNSLYAAFKVHRLAVDGRAPLKWHCPSRNIEEKELCSLKIFIRLIDQPLLSNLKHLAVGRQCEDRSSFALNQLNKFGQLVHLEIGTTFSNEKVNLNLPKLKILLLLEYNFNSLSIDCPELKVLHYFQIGSKSLLDVKQPETIRRLQTNIFGPKLTRFENVECLLTDEFRAISQDTLRSLPRLQVLRYHETIKKASSAAGSFDRMKRALGEFVDGLSALRRSNFRFRFAGLQVTKMDELDFGVQVNGRYESGYNEYLYMKNYQLIDLGKCALSFIFRIDYNHLKSNWRGEIPVCFYQKFASVRSVHASDVVQNETHFLWFIKSLSSTEDLQLSGPQLSQAFFDQLPASAPKLVHLALNEDNENELQLSFDFIRDLPHLSGLSIPHRPLPFESQISLVRSLARLAARFYIYFRISSKAMFSILRKPSNAGEVDKYEICENHQMISRIQKPEEIVTFFERLQSDTSKTDQESN